MKIQAYDFFLSKTLLSIPSQRFGDQNLTTRSLEKIHKLSQIMRSITVYSLF